eukprot:251328-Amphidinium_carterae.1
MFLNQLHETRDDRRYYFGGPVGQAGTWELWVLEGASARRPKSALLKMPLRGRVINGLGSNAGRACRLNHHPQQSPALSQALCNQNMHINDIQNDKKSEIKEASAAAKSEHEMCLGLLTATRRALGTPLHAGTHELQKAVAGGFQTLAAQHQTQAAMLSGLIL